MKKILKRSFILSLILLGCGLIGTVTGLFLGGANDWLLQAKQSYFTTKETVEQSLGNIPFMKAFFNIEGFSFELNDGKALFSLNEDYEKHSGDYFDFHVASKDEITSLEITDFDSVLTIRESKGDSFGIESRNAGDFQYYVEDGTFYIGVFPEFKNHSPVNPAELIVYIPGGVRFERAYVYFMGNRADIECTLTGTEGIFLSPNGDELNYEGLVFDTLKLQNGTGSSTVKTIEARDVLVDVGAGDCVIDSITADEFEGNVSSGDLSLSGDIRDVNLKCGMGDVEFYPSRSENEYSIDLTGRPKEILIGNVSYSGPLMNTYIAGTGEGTLKIKCDMGNVKVGFY